MTGAELIAGLVHWLGRLMPAGARRDRLVADLRAQFEDRDGTPVTAEFCRAVEQVAWQHSRHLLLVFEADGTAPADTGSRGWPPPDGDAIRERAAGVSLVERLDGGACLVRIDTLDHLASAEPFVDAAFTLAAHASEVLLDLRANGGGDPATVALIAGWLLGGGERLSEVVYTDRRREWSTPDRPRLTQPVQVLVSERTFSSAEALTYHLQARGRVTVVGAATPGAADHITPIRLGPQVLALLPEAYVRDVRTGTSWEGRGVVPDRECPAADAVSVACR